MFFYILCYPILVSSKAFQEASMTQLKNLFILLLLVGFSVSSIASVSDVETTSCNVYSEDEEKPETDSETGGDETTDEEEPDCD
jgi:hypothetical protein